MYESIRSTAVPRAVGRDVRRVPTPGGLDPVQRVLVSTGAPVHPRLAPRPERLRGRSAPVRRMRSAGAEHDHGSQESEGKGSGHLRTMVVVRPAAPK